MLKQKQTNEKVTSFILGELLPPSGQMVNCKQERNFVFKMYLLICGWFLVLFHVFKVWMRCFVSAVHLSRGPSPISFSTQEAWPVAAAITEYINAYFKGGQHNR